MIHSLTKATQLKLGALPASNTARSIVDEVFGADSNWVPYVRPNRPKTRVEQGLACFSDLPLRGANVEGLEMLEFRLAESYVQRYHMLAHGHTSSADDGGPVACRGWENLLSADDRDPNSIEHVAILGEN